MWKWTDPINIKAIIIDCDSLDDELINYDYDLFIKDVYVFKVKEYLESDIEMDDVMVYSDCYTLIQEIMKNVGCSTYSIISVSKDEDFIKSMMQYHIGTIFADEIKRDSLMNVPDYSFKTIKKLNNILSFENAGYASELYSLGIDNKKRNILSSHIDVTLSSGDVGEVTLYFGGRYYPKNHHYLEDDPLSVTLLYAKDNYVQGVDNYYDSVINHIHHHYDTIDIVSYIPLKPMDIENNRIDRFKQLKLKKTKKEISVQEILTCNKDFSQKSNDYYARHLSVQGAFQVIGDVNNKHVVILDDLYTSGSTIREISKVLYEAGANKVSAILLAVNQTTESSAAPYKKLKCTKCGSDMILRMGSRGLFFGCSCYDTHKEENTTVDVTSGIKELKNLNCLEAVEVVDLDDKY